MSAEYLAGRPRVPEIVRLLRRRIPLGHAVALRLTTDARMTGPWEEVQKQAKKLEKNDPDGFRARLAALPDLLKANAWLGSVCSSTSLKDQACAAFFLAIVTESAVPKKAVSANAIGTEAKRWRAGAALCREAAGAPHRTSIDPELKETLRKAGAYFDEWATFIETASEGRYKIGRRTRKHGPQSGDAAPRGYVRAIAAVLNDLLGSPHYGTIATTATVVLNTSISPKSVEHWCANLAPVSQ